MVRGEINQMITTRQVVAIVNRIAAKIKENKDYLSELDEGLGDGDHGTNLSKGFEAVVELLNKNEIKDIGEVLQKTGMTLATNVGGVSGALYGTAFIKAANVLKEKERMDIEEFVAALKAFVDGIKLRGKAEFGQKTMLDALVPAYEAALKTLEQGEAEEKILEKVYKAAEKGAASTEGIFASKGRASYFGDNSLGKRDPGAQSSAIILKAIYDSVIEMRA